MKRLSELSAASKAVEIVRWICVLPAACLASLLPRFASALLLPRPVIQPPGFTPTAPPSDILVLLRQWLVPPLTAIGFVLVGSLVAPRHRRYVAIVLAVLLIAEAFLSHVFVHLGRGKPNVGDFAAIALAALASAALVFYLDRRRPNPPDHERDPTNG
jgi:hypothetical protein